MQAVQLTRIHRILIGVVVTGAVVIAAIGFAGSFSAVRDLAEQKGFGSFSPFFPIGIDAGIVVLLALDLLLTWIRIPFPLLRQAAWLLTAATIAFNGAAAWPDPLGVGMHAAIPILFVVTVEAARHAIGRIADITADKHMEGVRLSRWLLAFPSTFRLWRRMKLWELRSYDEVIRMEQERLIYEARLRGRYGRGWRRKAPLESRMPLKLARYGVPLAETAPAGPDGEGLPTLRRTSAQPSAPHSGAEHHHALDGAHQAPQDATSRALDAGPVRARGPVGTSAGEPGAAPDRPPAEGAQDAAATHAPDQPARHGAELTTEAAPHPGAAAHGAQPFPDAPAAQSTAPAAQTADASPSGAAPQTAAQPAVYSGDFTQDAQVQPTPGTASSAPPPQPHAPAAAPFDGAPHRDDDPGGWRERAAAEAPFSVLFPEEAPTAEGTGNGAAPAPAQGATDEATSSTAYAAEATGGPQVTVPVGSGGRRRNLTSPPHLNGRPTAPDALSAGSFDGGPPEQHQQELFHEPLSDSPPTQRWETSEAWQTPDVPEPFVPDVEAAAPYASPSEEPRGLPEDVPREDVYFAAYRQYLASRQSFPDARQLSKTLYDEFHVSDRDGNLLAESYLRTYLRDLKERYHLEMGIG